MKIIFLSLFFCIPFLTNAQGNPTFPNIDQVFKNTLGNEFVYKALKEDYGIENPKECKFEKKMRIGMDEVVDSDWGTYQSGPAQEAAGLLFQKWPDDRAYTVFTVTTPKNKDGVSYILPLIVEYSRFTNGMITNEWEYYWWKFETPYKTDGKLNSEVFFEMMLNKLKNIEVSFDPGGYPECPKALQGFYRINSIYESPEEDKIEKYSNREHVVRVYYVTGDYLYMPGSEYDTVYAHYKNRIARLSADFTRELDMGKPIADWVLNDFTGGWSVVVKEGDKIEDYEIMPTMERFGWEYVYQKNNSPIGKAYFSDAYKKDWAAQLKNQLIQLYLGNSNAIEYLNQYAESEGIITQFQSIFNEITMKQCYIPLEKEIPTIRVSCSFDRYSNTENTGTARISFSIKRDNCLNDGALKKKYKEAGMSKDILKSGGKYYNSETLELKIIVKNNQFVIVESPKLKKEITF